MKRGFSLALLTSMILAVLSINAPANAASSTAGGDKDCSGSGNIVPTVTKGRIFFLDVDVKEAGPPATADTWSAHADGQNSADFSETIAYVSPFANGHWGASSNAPDQDFSAFAACSHRAAPTATAKETISLGDKSCASG